MINKFKKIALGAALLTASAASFAGLPFTVDESQGFTDTGGAGQVFTANKIAGTYNEVVRLNNFATGQFSATIVLGYTSFVGQPFGTFPGLNTANGYGMYSVINIEGNVTSNNLPASISTGNWSGNYNMVLDVNGNTDTFTAGRITNIGMPGLSAAETADDVTLLSGTIQSGGSVGNRVSGGYSLLSGDVDLTAAGENFFVAPTPFYNMLLSNGDLEDFFSRVSFNLASEGLIQRFVGEASVEFVPEPSLIALFGLGLFGLGLRARKS